MLNQSRLLFLRWPVGAYVCIATALALVVALGVWGAYNELSLAKTNLLQAEISDLQSQAVRRVGRLESGLERFAPSTDWKTMANAPWLQRYWQDVLPTSDKYLYTSILNPQGEVILHTNPELEGKKLERRWYDRIVWEAGHDVFELNDTVLSDFKHAFDIRIPILMNKEEIGEYHEGLSAEWFNEKYADQQQGILWRWIGVIGGILIIVVAATASLLSLAQRSFRLGEQIDQARFHHLDQVEKLAAGIVHEIRNPLHAFRLNLHALKRMQEGRVEFSQEEVKAILEESNREIERVERLLQELLGFASPVKPKEEIVDVGGEVQSTANFLHQELSKSGVELHLDLPQKPVFVRMDPGRFRQVMLNLIMNAKEATNGSDGNIFVKVEKRSTRARITISDDGPGIKQKDLRHIFDPFFTTKTDGSGLGLAMVKRFIEEVDGTVNASANGQGGASFCVELPEVGRNFRRG